jgi:peptidoglycan/LPS O-acetylase OafA/YrhL
MAFTAEQGPAFSNKKYLPVLDGVRFIAAFTILWGHAWGNAAQFSDYPGIASYGGAISLYGMPLFFVLSGFVIHYNYSELFETSKAGWAVSKFFSARIARLYPLFIASVFVGYSIQGIFLWLGHYDFAFYLLTLHNITFTQSWFYQIMFQRLMLYFGFGMGWSISTEVFFYIGFLAFVIPLSRQAKLRPLLIVTALYAVTVIVLLVFAKSYIDKIGVKYYPQFIDGPYRFSYWFFYFSPYVRIFEFVLGCMTAQIYLILADRKPSIREIKSGYAIMLFCLVIFLLSLVIFIFNFGGPIMRPIRFLEDNFGLAVPIALFIFCVARYPSPVAAVLESRPMVLLGERSYSIYAVHVLLLQLFTRPAMLLTPTSFFDSCVRAFLTVVCTLILGSATNRLI